MSTQPNKRYNISQKYKDHLVYLVNKALASQERMYEHLSKMEYHQARKARREYHKTLVSFKTTCYMELSGCESAEKELKKGKQ